MLTPAIVKERQKGFLTHHSQIKFNKDDAIKFAVDDTFEDINREKVSLASIKICYQSIAKASKDGYFCNASQKKIAKISGLSLRTVGNCIRVLRRTGRISVLHNYKRNDNNQARRITSYMRLRKFGDWVKRRLDSALEQSTNIRKGLKANLTSLFHISINTGEIQPSKWRFLRDFTDNIGLARYKVKFE